MSSGEMKVIPVMQQKKNKEAQEEARQNNLMCPMNYDTLILEPITFCPSFESCIIEILLILLYPEVLVTVYPLKILILFFSIS